MSSKTEQIIYDEAKKSVEQLGESASKVLLDHICSINGLSEKELLTNYDLFEKLLHRVLKEGADIILQNIKRKLLVHAVLIDPNITIRDIRDPRLTVDDILKRLRAVETLEFVRKIPSHEHIAFLYRDENSKDAMLAAFFDTKIIGKTSMGLFSTKRPANQLSHVNNIMLYQDLLQEPPQEYEVVARKVADWTTKLHSLNKPHKNNTECPTRIAGEDAMWWFRNGFASYILGIEKSMGRYLQENMSVLCGYNISNGSSENIDNEDINSLIAAHSYVIIDEPFIVYTSANA